MRALPRSGVLAIVLAAALLGACKDEVDPADGACEDYCELTMRNCQGVVAQYTDLSTCKATCAAMPIGDPTNPHGHNIACRTFEAAIAEDPNAAACTAAGPGGDGTCGANCESFCAIAIEICGDQPGSFSDLGTCMTACATYDTTELYDASDIAGNSFACRLYHLTAASTNPGTHCPHIVAASPVCL